MTIESSIDAVTILLVEDHEICRLGMRRLIETQQGWRVVGEASTVDEARRLAESLRPQVTIVDLRLRREDGVELVRCLSDGYPAMLLLVCSVLDPSLYAERCLQAGAAGYVTKGQPAADLIAGIERALAGGTLIGDEEMTAASHGGKTQRPSLSPRERQVYAMLGAGQSVKQIAAALNLSPKTVEYHRQQLKRKLQLASGAALARHAMINPLQ